MRHWASFLDIHAPQAQSMDRPRRHATIRQLLAGQAVRRQAELVDLLRREGFRVTQASVSRDLRELGAAKIQGAYRLEPLGEVEPDLPGLRHLLPAGPHLLVVGTVVGGASRVGLALDTAGWSEVVGTVAGDDTVFVATRSLREQRRLVRRLERWLSGKERA
jgi:transcriptional regulator of arginine metabolism